MSQSLFGLWLGWMSDPVKRGGAYVVVAMNDPSRVPREALRQGRFDDGFFFGLPAAEARAEIFRIHLRKRLARNGLTLDDLEWTQHAWRQLAEASDGLLPAEIETCASDAFFRAFADRKSRTPTLHEVHGALDARFGGQSARVGLDARREHVARLYARAAEQGARPVAADAASKPAAADVKISKGKAKKPQPVVDRDDDDEDDD